MKPNECSRCGNLVIGVIEVEITHETALCWVCHNCHALFEELTADEKADYSKHNLNPECEDKDK
jgi:hypothetical protein